MSLLSGILLTSGCRPFERPPKIKLEAAHQKALDKLRDDSGLPDSHIFPVGQTVWVYIPFAGPLTDYKAARKNAPDAVSAASDGKWTVHHLAVTHENREFTVTYDIRPQPSYPKDPGYTSAYTETFNSVYQKALNALRHGYFDAEEPPIFAVLVLADITRGVKLSYTMTLADYKFYSVGQLPHEEFMKRMLTELAGDPALIDDRTGRSLPVTDVTWPAFIARQIETRVNFRYGRSAFPPSEDTVKEILHQIYQTLKAYDFTNCQNVILHDLRTDSRTHLPCADLDEHSAQPLPSGGKLHTIQFFQ